jgi:hypothetical protein
VTSERRFSVRLCVSVSAALAALVCGGCGTQDDEGAQSRAAVTGPSAADPSVAGDEDEIASVLRVVQEDYDSGDGRAYCDKLIASEQREVAAFGRSVDRGTTCESTIEASSRLGKEKGVEQRPTRFISARIEGGRAIARVRNGGRAPESMVFLKRRGGWKIVESGFEPDPLAFDQGGGSK